MAIVTITFKSIYTGSYLVNATNLRSILPTQMLKYLTTNKDGLLFARSLVFTLSHILGKVTEWFCDSSFFHQSNE